MPGVQDVASCALLGCLLVVSATAAPGADEIEQGRFALVVDQIDSAIADRDWSAFRDKYDPECVVSIIDLAADPPAAVSMSVSEAIDLEKRRHDAAITGNAEFGELKVLIEPDGKGASVIRDFEVTAWREDGQENESGGTVGTAGRMIYQVRRQGDRYIVVDQKTVIESRRRMSSPPEGPAHNPASATPD